MTTDAGMLELIEIEALFSEEPPCESKHVQGEACSIQVTHRYIAECEPRIDKMVCLNSAVLIIDAIAGENTFCEDCERPAAECWQVIPV